MHEFQPFSGMQSPINISGMSGLQVTQSLAQFWVFGKTSDVLFLFLEASELPSKQSRCCFQVAARQHRAQLSSRHGNTEGMSSPSGVPFNELKTRARNYIDTELDDTVTLARTRTGMPPRAHPAESGMSRQLNCTKSVTEVTKNRVSL